MRRLQGRPPEPDDQDSGHAPRRGGLPAELSSFVGRHDDLTAVGALLEESRLVTVVGVGGIGKTRCAVRIASLLEKRYCHGVGVADLAGLGDSDLLEHAVADALGLTDHTRRPPRTILLEHLADREVLLVLDGYEQHVDACAGLVRELLRRAPRLRVLAAGRLPLRVDGEVLHPLAPMGGEDALELFAARAGAVRPGFALTDAVRETVRELCRRLDGIPLALELAAGRMRALAPEQILQRLDDRFRLLTGGSRSAPARHQTLRTAIGWSHELCAPVERLLWARLSVFAGQFDLEAAEYICGGPGLPADTVLDVLDALIAQSVVLREDSPAGTRYRLLDTIREYGAQWLSATGDAERLRRRHRDWFLGLATWCELDWFSPRQEVVAARVECELPNLRRAMECSMESSDEIHLAQYLAGTLWYFWVGCGRLAEGRYWLEHVLDEDATHDPSRLKAQWVLGYVAVLQGDTIGAIAALQDCREGAEQSGDDAAAAYAVHRTGCLALVTDDVVRAEELLRDALARYREVGELNSNVLMAQVELGMARVFQGDLEDAAAHCREVEEVCDDHGERWVRAYALYVLAFVALREGRPGPSRRMVLEALATGHRFHDPLGSVLSLELLALLTAVEGDAAEAAVLQGAASAIWPSVGVPVFGSAHYGTPRAECAGLARAELGDDAYGAALRAGALLDYDTAVRRALTGGRRHPVDASSSAEGLPPGGVPAAGETRRPAASRMTGRGGPEL